MIKHSVKLVACLGILGAAVLANDAKAMTNEECEQLPGNMYLAAIERGECDVTIQTAAGPDELIKYPERPRRTREGRNGGNTGGEGGEGGEGGKSGGSRGSRTHP
jgi:uncharacterized membrane protein YgcG